MKFTYDHDLHIHSHLSLCSGDPEQNNENILKYAIDNDLKYICLTDHFWDESYPCSSQWYRDQNLAHIKKALPLPQVEGVRFMFGCETEMDKNFNVCISKEIMDILDFVIIPTTHLHMTGLTIEETDTSLEKRAILFVHRFNALLNNDFPENKVGIAHITCPLLANENVNDHLRVLDMIPASVFAELFQRTKEKKIGVELNLKVSHYTEEQLESVMRPYFIAKEQGCKFYLGSDAHKPLGFERALNELPKVINILGLEESDKFIPSKTTK